MKKAFQNFAQWASRASGSPWAFLGALFVVLLWAVTGPMFNFADTWQLVINTGTTIVTFLMVFLIQNTQNRDTVALHAKVDELLIKLEGADNALVMAEDMPDDELEELMAKEKKLASELPSSGEAGQEKVEAAQAAGHAANELQRRRTGETSTSRSQAHRRATSSNHKRA
jgi:low affinity Fe/Cu permease